ncbi:MAG: PP2C family protein-serine/threonine phosphatase [Clostridiales bacterium]|nr:PP2C family protein-serine/threonine phosphatase [Candidatus Equinaster intestinalis]
MLGSVKKRMNEASQKAAESGDVFMANEITANVMVGSTMIIIVLLLLGCLFLNELGIFTVDKWIMRLSALIALLIVVPITIINFKYIGEKLWLRRLLMADLIVVCAILAATLTYNVTLLMVVPVIISTRYFDRKYTTKIAIFTAILFLAAEIISAFYGAQNLNMYYFTSGAEFSVQPGQNLGDVIASVPLDRLTFLQTLLTEDYLGRCATYFVVSVICCYIAQRGKDMIEMESENAKKSSRIETELSLATSIQANMLPTIFPERNEIDLYATMTPAKEVGGDFYDFFMIDDNHLAVVMADVSGKGVPAALFMVIAKTLIKDHTSPDKDLGDVFAKVNDLLCESNSEGLFVTAFEGVLDLRTGEFRFVNAGHEMPFICKKGHGFKPYPIKSAFVLAGMENMKYKPGIMNLDVGDKLFQYTDGVTEATNADNELYGMVRLEKALTENAALSPAELLPAVKADIDDFVGAAPQFDDITMLCFEFKEKIKAE